MVKNWNLLISKRNMIICLEQNYGEKLELVTQQEKYDYMLGTKLW